MMPTRNLVLFAGLLLVVAAAQAIGLLSAAIGPQELSDRLSGDNPPLVIDVRSPGEYSAEHIPGAVNIPAPTVGKHLEQIRDRGSNAVLYCNDLRMTKLAEQILMRRGVKDFSHLEGGFNAWTLEGLPVEQSFP